MICYPPKTSVSALVNSLKVVSSRLLKKNHQELVLERDPLDAWLLRGKLSRSPISIIRQYI